MKGVRGSLRCSFCGKGRDDVRKLVAGPGVYICDRCVQLCNEILDRDSGLGPSPGPGLRTGRLAGVRARLGQRAGRWLRLWQPARFAPPET